MYHNNIKNFLTKTMMEIPTPSNISLMWNFGSLLGISMFLQVLSGFFLSMHYVNHIQYAFFSYITFPHFIKEGMMLQMLHAHISSLIFIIMYIHILKSLLNKSFKKKMMWLSGNMMLIMTMMSAFLGYVLPWGQMSFWGATVITNILSSIPFLGSKITNWVWGGFTVDNPTLNRFFSIHFLVPFIILFFSIVHLSILHEKGSSNQLGINSSKDKIMFGKSFIFKDLISITIFMLIYFFFFFFFIDHHFSMAKENFFPADPMNTPTHIKPEWYFMFAYSILRSIPNKGGGIIALLLLFLLFFQLIFKKSSYSKFSFFKKIKIFMLLMSFIILTNMGYKMIETPYTEISLIMSMVIMLSLILI